MTKLIEKLSLNQILISLLLFGFILAMIISSNFLPNEDALILFRYAENFSETGIISYNPNSEKVEGATDFLWMILLSIFSFLNFDIFFSAIMLNTFSLSLVSIILVKEFNLKNYYAYIIFLFHLFLGYAWSSIFGFSVLFVELILILFLISFKRNNTLGLLMLGFIGTLIRPDFILFIILICAFHFFKNISYKKIFYYLLFTSLGLVYFYWRYHYFGLLFPLPYYVKSQWDLFHNLSWYREILIMSPFLYLLKYVKLKKIFSLENNVILLSAIIIPTLYYTNQILYQNIGNRFYFYLIVVIFFLILTLVSEEKIPKKIFLVLIFISCIISLFINFSNRSTFVNLKETPRYLLPVDLKKKNISIKLATTEAGSIPFYSKLYTVDLFGLNTKELAKKPAGGKYLIDNDFDIILITSGQFGTNCNGLKKFYLASRNIKPKEYIDRNSNWDTFTMQLLSGINKERYQSFLIPIYSSRKDDNSFFFIDKKSKEFSSIQKSMIKFGKECKF